MNNIAIDDFVIGIIEFLLLFFCLIISTIFGILMWKTKTIHLHLRLIFLNMVIATYGESITRVWLTVLTVFFPTADPELSTIVGMGPGIFASYFTLVEISIAIERLTATFLARNYENSKNPIMLFNILIPWILTIVLIYFASMKILINFTYFSYFLIICNVFTWMCFIILYIANRKMYSQNIATLSEKYQLSENIRITKLLAIFVVFTAIRNSVSIFYILIQVYLFIPNSMLLHIHILSYAYRLYLALFFAIYPVVLIYFHKSLRKNFITTQYFPASMFPPVPIHIEELNYFRKRVLRIKSGIKIFNKVSSQNVIGKQMYTNFAEVDYFQGLKQQWESGIERLEKNRRASLNTNVKPPGLL